MNRQLKDEKQPEPLTAHLQQACNSSQFEGILVVD